MPSSPDVTVVIPTIPPRSAYLARAISSVSRQSLPVAQIIIPQDTARAGAAKNRQAGLEAVRTPWVAFLDDDDEFYPNHLELLTRHAADTDADYVFSWYEVVGGTDPRPDEFGLPWDPEAPRQTTITTLVRTELAQAVGFVWEDDDLASPDRHYAGEDWFFTQGCAAQGATISHLPEKTWFWHHHGGNTSGLPNRW